MKVSIHKAKQLHQEGFTIIELLIATAVFAGIFLLLILSSFYITNENYRGVSQANNQNAVRTIIDSITQSIEFSSVGGSSNIYEIKPTAATSYIGALCIGNASYTFALGQPYNAVKGSVNVLVYDSNYPCTSSPPTFPPAGTNDLSLMPGNTRLASLSMQPVSGSTNLYKIEIRLVYGDNDLLCSPAEYNNGAGVPAAGCNDSGFLLPPINTMSNASFTPVNFQPYAKSDLQCKHESGSQFCDFSDITTYAQERVQ